MPDYAEALNRLFEAGSLLEAAKSPAAVGEDRLGWLSAAGRKIDAARRLVDAAWAETMTEVTDAAIRKLREEGKDV